MRYLRGAVFSNPAGRGSIMRMPTGMGFDWGALANIVNVAATDASTLIRQTQGGPPVVATGYPPGYYPPGTYPTVQTSLLPAGTSSLLLPLAAAALLLVLVKKR